MKNLFFFVVIVLGLSSCETNQAPKPLVIDEYMVDKAVESEIVSSYETNRSDENICIFQLSNGQEVFVYQDRVFLHDKHGESIDWCFKFTDAFRNCRRAMVEKWHRARTGLKVKIYFDKDGNVIEMLPDNPNYTKVRVVTKVTKYDGHLSKIDGKMTGHFLSGSSGSLHGESMGSENFFINIYFQEGEPLYVDAKQDRKWLDVEPGDTIVERMLNGLVSYNIR